MNRIEFAFLLLTVLLASNSVVMALPYAYAADAKADLIDRFAIQNKFDPLLWDKIQALRSNGTVKDLSLIIRLVRNQRITGMEIKHLKNYVTPVFTENHNTSVYYVGNVLPVLMARVPVVEAEKIAAYQFVESIGDGDRVGYITLDVSRPAIRAYEADIGLGYTGSGIKIAILDTGINSSHPDLDDLDDNPATSDPKVIHEISFVDKNRDGVVDEDPMDYHGHGTRVAGIAAGTGYASGYQYIGIAPKAWLLNIKVAYLY